MWSRLAVAPLVIRHRSMHGSSSPRTLRELWDARVPTLGGWCSIPNSFAAEIMASIFDWCCIDMQHGLAGQDSLITMLQSIAITGTPAFVRVPWNQPGDIMRAFRHYPGPRPLQPVSPGSLTRAVASSAAVRPPRSRPWRAPTPPPAVPPGCSLSRWGRWVHGEAFMPIVLAAGTRASPKIV
jgi:hypothetical protein